MDKFVKINEYATIFYKNKIIKTPTIIPIINEIDLQELKAELRIKGIFKFEILENIPLKIERVTDKPVQKIVSTIPLRPSKLKSINSNKIGD